MIITHSYAFQNLHVDKPLRIMKHVLFYYWDFMSSYRSYFSSGDFLSSKPVLYFYFIVFTSYILDQLYSANNKNN